MLLRIYFRTPLCFIKNPRSCGDFLCREWYADIHPFLLYGNIRAWVVVFDDNGAVAGDVLSGSGEPFLHEPVVNAVKVSVGAAVTQYGVAPARDFARLERGRGVFRRDRGSNVFVGVQRVNGGVDAEGACLAGFGTAQAQQAFKLVKGVAEALAFAAVGEHGDGDGRAGFYTYRIAGGRTLAVLLRREAVCVAEAAREGLGVVVAAFARDVGDGFVGVADEPGGAVQAHPFDGGVQGFAHDIAVEAVPMPRRDVGRIGDALQIDAVGVVVFQIVQGAEEALFVVTFFHDFYDTASQRVLSLPQGDVVLAVAVGGIYLQANRDFQKRL